MATSKPAYSLTKHYGDSPMNLFAPMLYAINNLKFLGKTLPFGGLLMLVACATENQTTLANRSITQANLANPYSDVTNIIIGGGMINCSSMGASDYIKEKSSSRCTQPWATILREDEAFAGHSIQDFSFDATIKYPAVTYRLDGDTLRKFATVPATMIPASTRADLIDKLTTLSNQAQKESLRGLSWSQLKALLSSSQFGPAFRVETVLTVVGQAALRHSLAEALPEHQPPRLLQARSVGFLNDRSSIDIYRAIVLAAQAKAGQHGVARKPRIGIVTASAENPFNDRDINFHAFKSAGADVVWLPIEGGLRQAIDQNLCELSPIFYTAYSNRGAQRDYTHMDLFYPDLAAQQISYCKNNGAALNRELAQLDGIFFSGGNQIRHLESLTSKSVASANTFVGKTVISEQLRILRERFAQGKLLVTGSSAGDAVQAGGNWRGHAIPMIGGGDSIKALRHGFSELDGPEPELPQAKASIVANGGLGFFQFGALDSHFSQRSREARLVRMVADSGIDYGFGVDENTALIVHGRAPDGTTTMEVVGAGGVFVVDTRGAQLSSRKNEAFRIKGVSLHYIHQGDKLIIDGKDELSVELKTPLKKQGKQHPPGERKSPVVADHIQDSGRFGFQKLVQTMEMQDATTAYGLTARGTNTSAQDFVLTIRRQPSSEFRSDGQGSLSYSKIQLDIDICEKDCLAQIKPLPQ